VTRLEVKLEGMASNRGAGTSSRDRVPLGLAAKRGAR
jgi:hypothetical protein